MNSPDLCPSCRHFSGRKKTGTCLRPSTEQTLNKLSQKIGGLEQLLFENLVPDRKGQIQTILNNTRLARETARKKLKLLIASCTQ